MHGDGPFVDIFVDMKYGFSGHMLSTAARGFLNIIIQKARNPAKYKYLLRNYHVRNSGTMI